jgi:hypothetical protein
MASKRRPWIVSGHDPIEKLETNLWTVQGLIPGTPWRRRMFIVRQGGGSLLFAGAAVPLGEDALAEVMGWGRPAALVVPHHFHMIDAQAFATRLGLAVYGPAASARRTARRADMAGAFEDLPPDPAVQIEPVAGASLGEPVLIVRSGGRISLLFADVIQNMAPESMGWGWRVLGFTGGPKVTPAYRLFFLRRGRAGLRSQLQRWADLPGLCRLVPCHGRIVSEGAAEALRTAAGTL